MQNNPWMTCFFCICFYYGERMKTTLFSLVLLIFIILEKLRASFLGFFWHVLFGSVSEKIIWPKTTHAHINRAWIIKIASQIAKDRSLRSLIKRHRFWEVELLWFHHNQTRSQSHLDDKSVGGMLAAGKPDEPGTFISRKY